MPSESVRNHLPLPPIGLSLCTYLLFVHALIEQAVSVVVVTGSVAVAVIFRN